MFVVLDWILVFFSSSDVLEISPSVGSMAGGTVLTIKGKGFDERATKASVEVAGIKMLFDVFIVNLLHKLRFKGTWAQFLLFSVSLKRDYDHCC